MRKPPGYWNNYENCYNEARKYTSRNDFKHGNCSAYNVASKNKWIDDYTWFTSKIKPKGYWNDYEKCYEEAKKYNSRSKFKYGNGNAYQWAKENNWLDDYTWFENGYRTCTKWTYDKCLEESKKYNSRAEFCKKCVGGYTRALKRGWLDDFSWLKNENIMSDDVDSVYGYFFDDKAVYIGRTLMRTQIKRHYEHMTEEKDTVYKYAKSHNVEVPRMTILEDNLTIEEGSKREGYWLEYYKKNGYCVLNKQKTGGIGGIGRGKWNKKSCYNEALKYKTMDEFYTNSAVAYSVANDRGWVEEYTWLKRKYTKRNHWQSYDNCYNEAKKHKTMTDFMRKSSGAYKSASEKGWTKDYTWFNTNDNQLSLFE